MGILSKTRIRHSELKSLTPPFLIPAFPSAASMSSAKSGYISDIGFTGREIDTLDQGGLQHMHYRHRDYSPELGRFLQHDPLGKSVRTAFYEAPLVVGLEGPTLTMRPLQSILVRPGAWQQKHLYLQGVGILEQGVYFEYGQYADGLSLYQLTESNPIFYLDPYGLKMNGPWPWPGDFDLQKCLGYCATRASIPGSGGVIREFLRGVPGLGWLLKCKTQRDHTRCVDNCTKHHESDDQWGGYIPRIPPPRDPWNPVE